MAESSLTFEQLLQYAVLIGAFFAIGSIVLFHTLTYTDEPFYPPPTPPKVKVVKVAPEPTPYQQYKKRLQEEIRYARLNPWKKPATILRFPIERTRRPNGYKKDSSN